MPYHSIGFGHLCKFCGYGIYYRLHVFGDREAVVSPPPVSLLGFLVAANIFFYRHFHPLSKSLELGYRHGCTSTESLCTFSHAFFLLLRQVYLFFFQGKKHRAVKINPCPLPRKFPVPSLRPQWLRGTGLQTRSFISFISYKHGVFDPKKQLLISLVSRPRDAEALTLISTQIPLNM